MSSGQIIEQEVAAGGVVHGRGVDKDAQHRTEGACDQVPLASFDLPAGVDALA